METATAFGFFPSSLAVHCVSLITPNFHVCAKAGAPAARVASSTAHATRRRTLDRISMNDSPRGATARAGFAAGPRRTFGFRWGRPSYLSAIVFCTVPPFRLAYFTVISPDPFTRYWIVRVVLPGMPLRTMRRFRSFWSMSCCTVGW